jgi:23S rRNA (guanosine2251-2'-O)-methyltransferase
MKNQWQKNQNIGNVIDKSRKSRNEKSNKDGGIWLYGKHPTFSIIEKKRRKIFEILATQNTISELQNFLKKNSLSHLSPLVRVADNNKIESIIGKNQVHQGLAIRCSNLPIKNQNDLLTELYAIAEGEKLPTLLLLDQISDPQNVGAIIRSAAAFGVKKIIFSEHNAPKETAAMVKSSAGMIDLVDLICVTNFNNLIEKLKKINYWCIGLAGEGKVSISEIKGYKNIALIIGSEGDGMRDLVKKNCDILAKIEINKEVESLNASVAAAISLYELSKNYV